MCLRSPWPGGAAARPLCSRVSVVVFECLVFTRSRSLNVCGVRKMLNQKFISLHEIIFIVSQGAESLRFSQGNLWKVLKKIQFSISYFSKELVLFLLKRLVGAGSSKAVATGPVSELGSSAPTEGAVWGWLVCFHGGGDAQSGFLRWDCVGNVARPSRKCGFGRRCRRVWAVLPEGWRRASLGSTA